MAGNFVVLAAGPGKSVVEMAGVVDDLSRADVVVGEAGLPVDRLYIRLNVSRGTREAEHLDIIAQHAPAKVVGPKQV